MITWNVDGFTNELRRLEVTKYLWAQKVDIAIITESHLREEDIVVPQEGSGKERIFKFKLDGYDIVDWSCRESETVRIGGGVIVIARPWVNC